MSAQNLILFLYSTGNNHIHVNPIPVSAIMQWITIKC